MAWIFYCGFAGGFLIGFLVAWQRNKMPAQYAIIDGDAVLKGQLTQATNRWIVAEGRIEKAKLALSDYPSDGKR